MSSWVVPTIAAELWGVSVEHVLRQVRAGELPSRHEFGFLWVEVSPQQAGSETVSAPSSRKRVRSRRMRRQRTKSTFVPRPPPRPVALEPEAPPAEPPSPAVVALLASPVPLELSEQEGEALLAEPVQATTPETPQWETPTVQEPPEGDRDDLESPEDPDDGVPMNWRAARDRAAATRRRPPGR